MEIIEYPLRDRWQEILQRPAFDTGYLEQTVKEILNEVKEKGDSAVLAFTEKFDKANLSNMLVSRAEIAAASQGLDPDLKAAITTAKENIEKFHSSQRLHSHIVETYPGVNCWQKSVGIEKVGLYVPGGTAPLFSTVLMLAVPAKIAGCKEIVLCTPPSANGSVHPAILFTAGLVGVTKVFKVGGVQAIGAMAYGTESIPQVYKIFGPGNQYVTAAKQIVNSQGTAIDMPAGPSEVAVVADATANPAFIASDLLSQAEHGVDSQAVLITTDKNIVAATVAELEKQLAVLPRRDMAIKAIEHSKVIVVNEDELVDIINEYAPEHLILCVADYLALGEQIINAGSVFLGHYTPESAGDYASGTNHTLPTNGFAKAYSGVNLDSFVKKITFQEISKEGIRKLGPTIEIMAEAESLFAHKNAVSLRMS